MASIASRVRSRCSPAWFDLVHLEVAGEAAGADAEQEAALRQVVQEGDAMGEHRRLVIRQAGDTGPQLDLPGAGQHVGDQKIRRGDALPLGREVLADPGLAES